MSITLGIHDDPKLAETIRELALEGYKGPGRFNARNQEKYRWLRELGTDPWLDTGDACAAEKSWAPEIGALTTNNTLVNQVVQTGSMDDLIKSAARELRSARPDISGRHLVIEIGFLVNARLALGLVERFGVHVSVELHPDFGFDIEQTLNFGRRYYAINPDYFYIKVPMTTEGFIAVRKLSDEGIPVNYTLGFSARQNYLAARFSRPAFVNLFLGRLNSLVEENGLGSPENVGEKATLASYEAVRSIRERHSDISTRQIAASIRSGGQVATLAGVDVHTIPPKAAAQFLEMGVTRTDLRVLMSSDLKVDVSAPGLARLWDVDNSFISFVEEAVGRADRLTDGEELKALARERGVDLFHDWSEDERLRIREKGKIPDISRWSGIAVDDLMSMSALESFVTDQGELDGRIEKLIRETS
ncbi:MAG: transaldolase family protein [Armatimonadetes bacterium]|nr:transaldolase family protein [Armatimonadota bacterium]